MNEMAPVPARATAKAQIHSVISSELIRGTKVLNAQGEHLGTIMNMMIEKHTGQVAYAVMSFGGFLGIGEKYHPLPWGVLDYEVSKGGYVVDLDKRTLEGAPIYETNDAERWGDRGWRKRVDEYYLPYV